MLGLGLFCSARHGCVPSGEADYGNARRSSLLIKRDTPCFRG